MAQVQLLSQMLGEGIADLFRIMPKMMKLSGMGPGRVKVGEEWIEYDPQQWPDEMRVSVQAGLSPGQTEQKIQRLIMLLGLQKEALSSFGEGYMVTADQLFGTAVRIVEQSGFVNPNAFFTSPQGKEMPQPPPDPKQIDAEVNAKNLQAGRALELARLEFDKEKERHQTARLEAESLRENERELLRIQMEREVRLKTAEISANAQIEVERMREAHEKAENEAEKTLTLERDESNRVKRGVIRKS